MLERGKVRVLFSPLVSAPGKIIYFFSIEVSDVFLCSRGAGGRQPCVVIKDRRKASSIL